MLHAHSAARMDCMVSIVETERLAGTSERMSTIVVQLDDTTLAAHDPRLTQPHPTRNFICSNYRGLGPADPRRRPRKAVSPGDRDKAADGSRLTPAAWASAMSFPHGPDLRNSSAFSGPPWHHGRHANLSHLEAGVCFFERRAPTALRPDSILHGPHARVSPSFRTLFLDARLAARPRGSRAVPESCGDDQGSAPAVPTSARSTTASQHHRTMTFSTSMSSQTGPPLPALDRPRHNRLTVSTRLRTTRPPK